MRLLDRLIDTAVSADPPRSPETPQPEILRPAIPRDATRRILAATILAELRRTREPGSAPIGDALAPWSDDLTLGEAGLGLDSLDMMHVGAAIGEMFQLDAAPDAADRSAGSPPLEGILRVPVTIGDWLDRIAATLSVETARLTMLTSGSTGVPQRCDHAVADLVDEAAYFAAVLPDRTRVVALVPANHIYGLIWTALLPARMGVPVIAANVAAMPALLPGDLIVAVPDQWRALARVPRDWPGSTVGISAGAPLDAALASDLAQCGPGRLIDVYGSSETGGIARREATDPVYTLLPRWRFAATDATGEPETPAMLIDATGRTTRLPDHVERVDDNRFVLRGRRDGAVQVGGINVWPRSVAAILARYPGVTDVAVRLGASGRLKAFVVADGSTDQTHLRAHLVDYARRTLSAAERPVTYHFGESLPVTSLGKARDWL